VASSYSTSGLSRTELLARGGQGVAVLLAGPAIGGLLPETARAETLPDGDLAYARLFVTVELLALDFYRNAVGSKRFGAGALADLWRARADERRHYDAAASILVSAGQVPATAADIDFSYPSGSFASRGSIARLGVRLESLALGAYLGGVEGLETNALKQRVARAAASEAQHLSLFAGEVGGRRIGAAFPRPRTIERVSGALEAFTS
jgi:Ferritin-like domain